MRGRPFQAGRSGNPSGRPRVVREVQELARQCAPDTIKELARLATRATSETARIAAIKELLDRGYGKSTQYVGGSDDMPPIETHLRISFVKSDGAETDELDEATKSP